MRGVSIAANTNENQHLFIIASVFACMCRAYGSISLPQGLFGQWKVGAHLAGATMPQERSLKANGAKIRKGELFLLGIVLEHPA